MLHQLIALQQGKESIASKENYVELNVILHQKSKFLNIIVCLVVTHAPNKTKNLE